LVGEIVRPGAQPGQGRIGVGKRCVDPVGQRLLAFAMLGHLGFIRLQRRFDCVDV
jgi:hypothetical protein